MPSRGSIESRMGFDDSASSVYILSLIHISPGIIKNHIGLYQDYAICLVPKCTSCADKFGILIPDTSLDANQVVNLRVLFVASPGWTFFSIDYQNIEVRTAANLSKEPELDVYKRQAV